MAARKKRSASAQRLAGERLHTPLVDLPRIASGARCPQQDRGGDDRRVSASIRCTSSPAGHAQFHQPLSLKYCNALGLPKATAQLARSTEATSTSQMATSACPG